MAIDQQAAAEPRFGFLDEPAQNLMIRPIKVFDAMLCLGEAELLGVYLLAAGDQLGDRAEAHADPWRAGVDKLRQQVTEHARIELVGFPIDVEVSAWKASRQ